MKRYEKKWVGESEESSNPIYYSLLLMLKTFSIIVLFISLVNASLIKGKITNKDGKALVNANIVLIPDAAIKHILPMSPRNPF